MNISLQIKICSLLSGVVGLPLEMTPMTRTLLPIFLILNWCIRSALYQGLSYLLVVNCNDRFICNYIFIYVHAYNITSLLSYLFKVLPSLIGYVIEMVIYIYDWLTGEPFIRWGKQDEKADIVRSRPKLQNKLLNDLAVDTQRWQKKENQKLVLTV